MIWDLADLMDSDDKKYLNNFFIPQPSMEDLFTFLFYYLIGTLYFSSDKYKRSLIFNFSNQEFTTNEDIYNKTGIYSVSFEFSNKGFLVDAENNIKISNVVLAGNSDMLYTFYPMDNWDKYNKDIQFIVLDKGLISYHPFHGQFTWKDLLYDFVTVDFEKLYDIMTYLNFNHCIDYFKLDFLLSFLNNNMKFDSLCIKDRNCSFCGKEMFLAFEIDKAQIKELYNYYNHVYYLLDCPLNEFLKHKSVNQIKLLTERLRMLNMKIKFADSISQKDRNFNLFTKRYKKYFQDLIEV